MVARKIDGAWHVDTWVDLPNGRRKRLRRRSPVQTRKGTNAYERELVDSVLFPSTPQTNRRFDDYAVEFLENYVRVHLKYATLVAYESSLRVHLVPFFGKKLVRDITTLDVARLQASLYAGRRSPKTVRNHMGVLSKALTVAKTWGYLDDKPEFFFPKVTPSPFRWLTTDECEALETRSTRYWFAMIHLARKTGMRLGELCALHREQLNLGDVGGSVHIDRAVWRKSVGLPKHDKIRTVPLSPETVAVLARHLERVRPQCDLVFPTARGTMRQERCADRGIRAMAKRAGLDPFGWHVLRHTFASHLVQAKVPLLEVKVLMGHSDFKETLRYAHLAPDSTADAVALLDGASGAVSDYLGTPHLRLVKPEAGDSFGQYLGRKRKKATRGWP